MQIIKGIIHIERFGSDQLKILQFYEFGSCWYCYSAHAYYLYSYATYEVHIRHYFRQLFDHLKILGLLQCQHVTEQ